MSDRNLRLNPTLALLRNRVAILRNLLLDFHRDSLAKVGVIVLGMSIVVAIAFGVGYESFKFIAKFPAIGPQLNSRLLGLLFLVLLTMVAISNAIVSYTSLFLAKETRFLFENPISSATTFFLKLFESIVFSGWATLVLCAPILVAFGLVRDAPIEYYFESTAILVLFIIFCGFLGNAVSLFLLFVVRRWTLRKVCVAAVCVTAFLGWGLLRSFDFSALDGEANLVALSRFTMSLTALQSTFVPSTWATSAILASSSGQRRELLFHAGVLLANTLVFFPVFSTYAKRLYGRRWIITAEPSHASRRASQPTTVSEDGAASPGQWWRPPGWGCNPVDSLILKDLLTFVRDPAQLSQFFLFLVLTIAYVLSLIQIPSYLFTPGWRLVLYFSNLAAISLILSSFTSRFLFPLVSLEGKAFWIVGLAPIDRSVVVRQKVRFGRYLILTLGALGGLGSCLSLGFGFEFTVAAIFTITLAGWILTALAIGFGCAYPNVAEDNPARIAVGFGGTLNFFASALAVIIVVTLQAVPYIATSGEPGPTTRFMAHTAALTFAIAVSVAAIRLGERSLRKMEF